MTFTIRAVCATGLVVLAVMPAFALRASADKPVAALRASADKPIATRHASADKPTSVLHASAGTQAALQGTTTTSVGEEGQPAAEPKSEKSEKKEKKSVFAEDGPVDTTWDAQIESFWRALVRLPIAALLSAILAFRPRRRGTPKRQA